MERIGVKVIVQVCQMMIKNKFYSVKLFVYASSEFCKSWLLIKGGQPPKVESVKSLFDKTNVHLFG